MSRIRAIRSEVGYDAALARITELTWITQMD